MAPILAARAAAEEAQPDKFKSLASLPRGQAALSLNGNMISAAGLSELESILKAVPSASSGGGATLFDCLGSFSDNDDDASD